MEKVMKRASIAAILFIAVSLIAPNGFTQIACAINALSMVYLMVNCTK